LLQLIVEIFIKA